MIPENGFIFSSGSSRYHLPFPIRFIWSNVSNYSLIAGQTLNKLGLLDFPEIKASLQLFQSKKDKDKVIVQTNNGHKVNIEGKIKLFIQLHDVYRGEWEFFIYSSSSDAKCYDIIIGNDFVERTDIKPYHFRYVSNSSSSSKEKKVNAVIRPL
jgi:hypothetical protein